MILNRSAFGAVAILLAIGPVNAGTLGSHSGGAEFLQGGQPTSRPIGHVKFCEANPGECQPNAEVVDEVPLDDDRLALLDRVNRTLNMSITAVTDADNYDVNEYWTYPDGAGDCEDFALAKRRALAEEGWPLSTLLIAVVRQASGAGHAVLTVRTDRGDLILDNLDTDIHAWSETPYTYLKRQDPRGSTDWIAILDGRDISGMAHETSSIVAQEGPPHGPGAGAKARFPAPR